MNHSQLGRQSASPTLNGRPSNPDGDWVITDAQAPSQPVYRYMASDNTDAYNVLQQWIAANPGREWRFARDSTQRLGQPGGQSTQQPQTQQYELYNRDTGEVIDTFPARNDDEALVRLQDFNNFSAQRRQNPDLNAGVRVAPVPGSTVDLQRQRAAQQSSANIPAPGEGLEGNWGILDY